ncbi:hypothetical protein HYC85_027082 [Camellia sinensis]|uniref:Uncharacterized protein n=1 Tax=Camellia sinensis TaxID=4442 RepID=A0A7J7G5D9_CAMSI|nr:hypothetical protein HYC85_027082 [Camellia sinensis]
MGARHPLERERVKQVSAHVPSPPTSAPMSPSLAKPKSSHPPLKCPMAGTFYCCPAPRGPPFVKTVISFCGRGTTNCLGHVAFVTELVKRWCERKTKLKSNRFDLSTDYAGLPLYNCVLVAGSQSGVSGAERINMPCIVLRNSLTSRAEFPSASAIMDGFGGADLTISRLRNKRWSTILGRKLFFIYIVTYYGRLRIEHYWEMIDRKSGRLNGMCATFVRSSYRKQIVLLVLGTDDAGGCVPFNNWKSGEGQVSNLLKLITIS